MLKLTQRTYRTDRSNPSEPKPRVGVTPRPKFLQGDVRDRYRDIAKKLARIRLLTKLNGMALSMLCQSWAEYLEATNQVHQ